MMSSSFFSKIDFIFLKSIQVAIKKESNQFQKQKTFYHKHMRPGLLIIYTEVDSEQ